METQPLTAADVAAVTDRNRNYGYGDGFGFGGQWVWVILLFALFGFGNGFGRNGNGLTQVELQQGFDTQSLLRGQEGIKNGLCDGFYAMNTNFLQGQNQLARDLCQGFAAMNAGLNENRFAAQNCCCETNRNIDAVRYENARNTCDIVNAIEKDGAETRKLIVANQMQDLRDKLADTRLELSQVNQNATIISALQPVPKPAYTVMSPYMSNLTAYGYSNGCCGNFA